MEINHSEMRQVYKGQEYSEYAYETGKSSIPGIILYTVLSFILSTIFFVLVITGLSLGVGTVVVWVGIPILMLTFAMISGIAAIERSIVGSLLGVVIPAPPPTTGPQRSWWKRGIARLSDPLTWKSLLYVLLKFPLSTIVFCIAVSFVATAVCMILMPLGYLVATYVLMVIGIHSQPDVFIMLGLHDGVSDLLNVSVTGMFDPIMFFKSFVWTLLGIGFWFLTSYILRGLGWLSAEFARVMLCPIPAPIAGDAQDVQYTYQRRPE